MKCFKMFVLTIVSFLFLGYINVSAENVATSEELLECLSNGGTCTLTANLDVSDRMVIDTGKTVVLDLNGKTLNLTYTTDNYAVLVKGNLTIQGNGTFTITNDFGIGVVGTLVIENGVFNNTENGDYLIGNWGSTTINGGKFNADYCAVNGFQGTTVINGGEFNSKSFVHEELGYAIYWAILGNVTINKGTFNQVLTWENMLTENSEVTYKLDGDNNFYETIEIVGNVTLDLNGKTITAADSFVGDTVFTVLRNGKLTINDSKGTGKITTGLNESVYSVVKMTKKGESATGDVAELVVNGGTLEGYYYAITGNGGRHDTKVTINDGKLLGLNPKDNLGIYQPQNGILNINGGEITGLTGVEVRAGKLVVTGGKITGTASTLKYESNGSGSTSIGGGITIAQHTTTLAIDAKISGGEISGKEALYVVFPEANPNKEIVKVEVSGGKFNTTVKDFLKENYAVKKVDNKFEVYEKYNVRIALLENVEAVLSTEYAEIGEEVTITLTPKVGFEFSKLVVIANDNTNVNVTKVSDTVYKFVMPEDEVAITVKYTPIQTTEIPVVGENAEIGVKDPVKTEEVLLETLEGITDETLKEVLENTSVKVKVEVEDVVATDETKEEFESALEDVKDAKLVSYFDITVAVKNALTNESVTTLTDLTKEIELMVEIPTNLEEVKEGYTRTYYIVREHNGKVERLENVKVSHDGKHVVFSSKEFSTYALAYTDSLETTTPDTGDNILSFVALGFISVAAIGMALNNLKRRTNR